MKKLKTVAFNAILRKFEVKIGVSNDKEAKVILEFNPSDDKMIADLNELLTPDSEVSVAIVEIKKK